jgi:hypothetical protein
MNSANQRSSVSTMVIRLSHSTAPAGLRDQAAVLRLRKRKRPLIRFISFLVRPASKATVRLFLSLALFRVLRERLSVSAYRKRLCGFCSRVRLFMQSWAPTSIGDGRLTGFSRGGKCNRHEEGARSSCQPPRLKQIRARRVRDYQPPDNWQGCLLSPHYPRR